MRTKPILFRYWWIIAPLGVMPALAANSALDSLLGTSSQTKDEFLKVEEAFRISASAAGPDKINVDWVIAPGYYLYKSRLKFAPPDDGATLGQPDLPRGEDHTDEWFGTQTVYRELLRAGLGVARAQREAATLAVKVTYQGCADAGLCYPPETTTLNIAMPAGTGTAPSARAADTALLATAGAKATVAGAPPSGYVSEQDAKANVIRDGSWWTMLSLFFVAGLGVAFTGCVLPTIPILSGIIVGAGKSVTPFRAFSLSLTYVLGMAFTYTAAGAITAASGLQVQALFQKAWVVLLFAALFVVMAASMFGAFALQMPSSIQTRLADVSNRQRGGTWTGVAIMGALSALIVTACVAPAMIAALAVISQSGDVVRGGAALFAMSIGMGMPLLVVGASAGKLLPRAGAWMDDIKRLAGCMMLAVAAWMLSRLLSDSQALLLFAVPAVAAAIVLWRFAAANPRARLVARALAIACLGYAGALAAGSRLGSIDPLHPLAGRAALETGPEFAPIRSIAELDAAVAQAKTGGKPVMLDFYADWCVSCKEMERYTFTDPAVAAKLREFVLLRADVTANNEDDQALFKRFKIFGPPTIAFYDRDGVEQERYRQVGYMKAAPFAELLMQAAP